MQIRRAKITDMSGLNKLLVQVLMVHHNGRPDLFKPNAKKYTDKELKKIIEPCLKDNGVLFGSYPYVRLNELEERSKNDNLTEGVINKRSKEEIIKYLTSNQINVIEQIDINYIHRDNTLHKRGKLIKENQFVYVGTKRKDMV